MSKHVISVQSTTQLPPAYIVKCSCGFRRAAGRNRLTAADIADRHKRS